MKEFEFIEKIGSESQDKFSKYMESIRANTMQILNSQNAEDKHSKINNGLMELRSKFEEINPSKIMKGSWFYRLFGIKLSTPEFLKRIKYRTQTINKHIDSIIVGLREGQDAIKMDVQEMENVYVAVKNEYCELPQSKD